MNRAYVPYVFLAYALVVSLIVLFALYQAFQLLRCSQRQQAVSLASAGAWRQIKFAALAISLLMVAGIAGLMILSAGKGEDITGIVAPAILVALISGAGAIVAAIVEKRVQHALA